MTTNLARPALLFLLALASAFAQPTPDTPAAPDSPPARGARISNPAGGGGPRGTAQPQPPRPPQPEGLRLDENLVLSIKGTITDGVNVDITSTFAGPAFVADNVVSYQEINGVEQPIIAHLQARIDDVGSDYRVFYQVTCRRPIITSTTAQIASAAATSGRSNVTSTVTYVDIGVTGSAWFKLGQPVNVLVNNGQHLTLTLSRPAP